MVPRFDWQFRAGAAQNLVVATSHVEHDEQFVELVQQLPLLLQHGISQLNGHESFTIWGK